MKKHIVFDCDGTLIDTNQLKYSLFPGIKELLLALSPDSLLYVWTARDRRSTLGLLQEAGVLHLFEGFCTMDEAYPKPHARGLSELLGEVDKAQVCVIGDTTNDIFGAKNFGVKSIGVAWNRSVRPEHLKEAGADFITSKPEECLLWVTQNMI
jgi:phosphoglycolate phosphatase